MSVRWLALLLVLALLPTAELVEQGVHAVEHVVVGEHADHDAHHDNDQGAHHDDEHGDSHDEHACTGLVHVCGSAHGAGLTASRHLPLLAGVALVAHAALAPPHDLRDKAALPPPHRPPIRRST